MNEPAGSAILKLDGLATFAGVFLNEELILSSDSMFHAHEVPVTLTGEDRLAICFARAAIAIVPQAEARPLAHAHDFGSRIAGHSNDASGLYAGLVS